MYILYSESHQYAFVKDSTIPRCEASFDSQLRKPQYWLVDFFCI